MEEKTKKIIHNIRKSTLFCELIPMEAQIGWPIPLRRNGKVYVTLIFFGANTSTQRNNNTIIFPPFAKITLDWSNQVLVEYVNFRFSNLLPETEWEKPIGIFPHPSIADWTVNQYQQKRSQLLSMYDEMFEMLAQGSSFPNQWSTNFSQLLRLLIEPSLEPYYRAIAPNFFDNFLGKKVA